MNKTFAIALGVLFTLILILAFCDFLLLRAYAEEPTITPQPTKAPDYIPPMVTYFVTSGVGYRIDPMGGSVEGFHRGVDLVGPPDSKVMAVADGIVVEHWPPPGGKFRGHPTFGGYIILQHHNGTFSCYGHLGSTLVHTRDKVTQGQVIGTQGATGIATGEHLHLELIINPLSYFEDKNGRESILEGYCEKK
jgi:murein DD-endopeptidase MepM/ murein hydrolase activator NlpD